MKNSKKKEKKKKLILKALKRFKSYNVFTEEIKKIALISRMEPNDSIETYAYGTSKDLVSEKEEIKCNNRLRQREK